MSTIERALNKRKQADDAKKASSDVTSEDNTTSEEPAQDVSTGPVERKHVEQESNQKPDIDSDSHNQVIDLDMNYLSDKGLVNHSHDRRKINEEYRAIKRKILSNAFGPISKTIERSNIVMVTSSKPGEGKTFTAVNLALSIASEQDKTVLLVDADVLRPNMMKTLGMNNTEGLIEYLLGERKSVSDIMLTTNIPNLKLIAAGKSHNLANELLASETMKETVDEFSTRYRDRIVIIDTPPLLGINETTVLANLAGQAIVVCDEGATRMHDVKNAISHLDPNMAVGFVVNKSLRSEEGPGYYGYYYGSEDR